MYQYTPAARFWIVTTIAAATIAAIVTWRPVSVSLMAWAAFVLLVLAAVIAHFFPIRSVSMHVSYRLTSVFIMAGALLLPPCLILPFILLAALPAIWSDRRSASTMIQCVFTISHTMLAASIASAIIEKERGTRFDRPMAIVALIGAVVAFVCVQHLIAAIGHALDRRTPTRLKDALGLVDLVTEGCFGILGAVIAGIWVAIPWLLTLVLPLLFLVHRLTETAHLAELARTDPKTGMPNSRHFEEALDTALRRSKRSHSPLAVLFIDIDHFKNVNDTYGHAAGDALLRQLGCLMTATLGKGAFVARVGGEEFAAFLVSAYPEAAGERAEALRSVVEGHTFTLDNETTVRCTISVGIATAPEDGEDARTLLEHADQAMYRAKGTRNATRRTAAMPRVSTATPTQSDGSGDQAKAGRTLTLRFPQATTMLLWGMIVSGAIVFVLSLVAVARADNWLLPLVFMALAVFAALFPVRLYETKQQKLVVNLSGAVVMAVVMLQPFAAPLVGFAGSATQSLATRLRRLDRVLFNLANNSFAAGCASGCYLLLHPDHSGFTVRNIISPIICTLVLVIANKGPVIWMISLQSRRPVLTVAREGFLFWPTNILLGLIGAILGMAPHDIGLIAGAVFIAPVILMRFTLEMSAKKNQEAIEILEASKASLEQAHEEKTRTLNQLIGTVSNIIDARDNLVWGHSRNVADYSALMGKELGVPEEELSALHSAGLLHDLGKVAIPERILHKPGRLTEEEFAVVKEHPGTGKRILSEVELLGTVALMVGDHHERYDGRGYPQGKKGDEISIGGRIIAVADTLDSILSDRSYSNAKPLSYGLAEIDRCSGTQFDPKVVAALHRVVDAMGVAYFTNSALIAGNKPEEEPAPIINFPAKRVG